MMVQPRTGRQIGSSGIRLGRLRGWQIAIWFIGLLVVVAWSAPFVWMVSTSFKPPEDVMTLEIEWFPRRVIVDNYVKVFVNHSVWRWIANSVIVSASATAASVLLGAMAGYALARLTFPGRDFIFAMFLASLMIPIEMFVIPLLIAFIRVGLANTYLGLILPTIPHVFSVYIFRQFFLEMPQSLEDSAEMDGASRWTIFSRIALPLSRSPAIASTIILFNLNWNNFLWPLLISFEDRMKTLTVGIASFAPGVGSHTQLGSFGVSMAAVTILSIPSLLVFFFLQRYFIEGVAKTGIKE